MQAELDRIALRSRAFFPVAAAQLSGNAVGRVLPGGGATAAAFTRLCAEAGYQAQRFVTRSDLPCGSTIGPITAAELGVATVDVVAAPGGEQLAPFRLAAYQGRYRNGSDRSRCRRYPWPIHS